MGFPRLETRSVRFRQHRDKLSYSSPFDPERASGARREAGWGDLMASNEICVCGHPQSAHRTYGCIGSQENTRTWCQCKTFRARIAILSRIDTEIDVLPWPELKVKSA
jgi:hypothetical protein